jgi:hypothetical protein
MPAVSLYTGATRQHCVEACCPTCLTIVRKLCPSGSDVAGVRVTSITETHITLEKDGVQGTLALGGATNPTLRSYMDEPSG